LSVALLGNMPPPSYQVTLPRGREWVYESAAGAFVALALAAFGLWYTRGRALRPALRRALLWLAAGCLAVAYSSWWLWDHRDAGLVPPRLAASVAVWMPGLWAAGCAVVLLGGWRHERGGRPERVPPNRVGSGADLKPDPTETKFGPGGVPVVIAGRALALAVVTLVLGGMAGELGLRPALVVFLPGLWFAGFGTGTEYGGLLAFLGGNLATWWAAWAVALWAHNRLRAGRGHAGPDAAPDRGG
jgi:hypothetical protein